MPRLQGFAGGKNPLSHSTPKHNPGQRHVHKTLLGTAGRAEELVSSPCLAGQMGTAGTNLIYL